MQFDALLEVAIGLVLTWLILSMATSQVQELIVEWMGWRSKFLEKQLMDMFHDKDLIEKFYNHPLIKPLYTKTGTGKERKPTSIPNPVFARVAVDVFLNAGKSGAEVPAGSMSMSAMRQSMDDSMKHCEENNEFLARTMKHLAPNLGENIKKAEEQAKVLENKLAEYRTNVETWFDTTMTQASAVYKKNAQTIALVIGFIIAIVFNVDSFHITKQLWRDPTFRQAIVAQAGNIDPKDTASFDATVAKLNDLSLPVGWNATSTPNDPLGWVWKVVGLFVTGTAASQGSPFWFEILRNLTGLKKSESSKK